MASISYCGQLIADATVASFSHCGQLKSLWPADVTVASISHCDQLKLLWPADVTVASLRHCGQLMAGVHQGVPGSGLYVHFTAVQCPVVPAPLRWRLAAKTAWQLIGCQY